MRSLTHLALSLLVAVCLIGFAGCQDSSKSQVAKTDSSHDDDHEHAGDDHDHDGHDHDGDDHDHGEHDGHDHDGDDHDHGDHEHADNYDDAVAELVAMQAKIKAGYSGDEPEDAHDLLHEVGHVLENIEKFVKNSDMDDETKKSVGAAIDELFGAYGAVDDKQHDLEGKDYKDVADKIEASIKTLQAQVTKKEKE